MVPKMLRLLSLSAFLDEQHSVCLLSLVCLLCLASALFAFLMWNVHTVPTYSIRYLNDLRIASSPPFFFKTFHIIMWAYVVVIKVDVTYKCGDK